ncbi:MAG: site-2 protease family protein [Patescibacteria group bacterium]
MTVIFYILVIIISVVIHEVSHGYIANLLGDPTAKLSGRLTLNPLVHLDPLGSIIIPAALVLMGLPVIGWAKPVPYNPYNLRVGKWGPAYVALAGPASNLIVAGFFSILIRLNSVYTLAPATFIQFSTLIVAVNIILAIFNLIPVPPLDGSKVLFAALPYHQRQIEVWLERYSLIFILGIIFFAGNILFYLQNILLHLFIGR